jgi:O-antigen/teichoic acid export membrane protein
MSKYGTPLIFTTISAVLLTISDRFIIKIFGEFSDVGIYTLAYKVGSLSNLLIIASFSLGFLPIAFRKKDEPDFERFFGKTLTLYILLTTLLTLGVSIFGFELIQLFSSGNESYWMAAALVPFIAFIFIFKALNNYFSYVFLLTKKTKAHAQVTISGVAVNIILNFILIAEYGIYGAVAATGLSYVFMAILSNRMASKQMDIPYEYRRIGLILLSALIFIAIGLSLNEIDVWMRILIKAALLVIYVLLLYFGLATKEEKLRVGKVITLLKTRGGLLELIKQGLN